MAEPQADDNFVGRMESIIGLLECVTEELMTEDIEEFKLNPSFQESLSSIYAARFALRDCIKQHKARQT